ncbi:hypothetical protein IGI04_029137 [Brassica rapa subsp. trilocularis]|uniref:NAC domain-containing protein n=1 Tax=Brassica rapa subsp. trilocularis TaxID=1813537 RepID=A0ABQ7L6N0_BRACM|nr:hypothetical protein IGI04_029137 [Brassica rapa subsp. trilocularis]
MEIGSSSTVAGGGQLSVPPGFRFHPTEEELLYYYLKKKVSYEPIDLDVIREVDLNKLEPWDLKEKCRIGSGPQNEWYFFSHKDKKYPTGTRTNRATAAGFWKATGRDKSIHLNSSKKIGLRKTLVFYTGRAPHGQKTEWIMHEYRLDDNENEIQNLLRLTSNNNNYGGDWSFLDKLLTTNMNQQQQVQNHQAKCFGDSSNSDQAVTHDHLGNNNGNERFPFHYLGNDANLLKFPK